MRNIKILQLLTYPSTSEVQAGSVIQGQHGLDETVSKTKKILKNFKKK